MLRLRRWTSHVGQPGQSVEPAKAKQESGYEAKEVVEAMREMRELLGMVAERGARYVEGVGERSVAPTAEAVGGVSTAAGKFPEGPTEARRVIEMLDEVGVQRRCKYRRAIFWIL